MSTIPEPLRDLLDDASMFPPGNTPLRLALAAHREHVASGHGSLLNRFVVADVTLPELADALGAQDPSAPLRLSVVVGGGAGAIGPAVTWATRSGAQLAGVELALRDEDDLPGNARRVTTVVDQLRAAGDLPEEVPVYVEPPRLLGRPSAGWLGALDEVAAADLHLKLRTGGPVADDAPAAGAVATFIDASLDRELRFKCTAGLHRAVHHRDPDSGAERHGFLNVLVATRTALDGGSVADVTERLTTDDAGTVLAWLAEAGTDGLVSARRWFTGFGSCSVRQPLEDLAALGLVGRAASQERG